MDVKIDALIAITIVLLVINVVEPVDRQEISDTKRHKDSTTQKDKIEPSKYSFNAKCHTTSKRRKTSYASENDVTWMRRFSAFPAQIEQTIISRERRQSASGRKGRALYFSGRGEVLALKNGVLKDEQKTLPRDNFTVEVWLKPEGGLPNDVKIIALNDVCRPNSTNGWSLGIRTHRDKDQSQGNNYDARFYFSLMTDRSNMATTLSSNRKYTIGRWNHVVATYNGSWIMLFVNGAQVASSAGQTGPLFGQSLAECKSLQIGGDMNSTSLYRGALNKFQIWNRVLSHSDIIRAMKNALNASGAVFVDSHIERRHELWRKAGLKTPGHVTLDQSIYDNNIGPVVPSCGETICDNPDVVTSYLYRWQLKQKKSLKYRVVNVMNDNGSDPMVSQEQIAMQDDALRVAYKRYNISWQLETLEIRNTTLRSTTILFGCDPDKVADGFCQLECNHTATGYDGGDCHGVMATCEPDDVDNGVCDVTCNTAYNDWDGGDCCDANNHNNCHDPDSPYRRYLSIQEYKDLLNLPNENILTVYFAYWTASDTIGVATFPWDQDAHTKQGGVVVHPDTYGASDKTLNLVHEFGHVLGLWHVHLGVSEMDCDDPCRETEASMSLGDLCSDTEPTPIHRKCSDPDGVSMASGFMGFMGGSCANQEYRNTPYKNYMSYTGNGCADHFSKQQVARMHCYIDLVHSSWTDTRWPSPMALAPQILASDNNSVTLTWVPPIGSASSTIDHVCSQCLEDYSVVQYANMSIAPVDIGFGFFGPNQAVGPPDAVPCGQSSFTPYSWVPHGMIGPCYGDQCKIELYLKHPVIVRRLSVWFPYVQDGAIRSIELVYLAGRTRILTPITAYCDMPYTAELTGEKKSVYKVIIRLYNADVAVDALAIQSEENCAICKRCPPLKYYVTREPRFRKEDDIKTTTSDLVFIDNTIEENTTYSYTIQASLGVHKQPTESPVLVYGRRLPYCGDGLIDSGETCDDGNHRNHDGCSLNCQTEDSFKCKGQPSLCYHYYGDGICESFELTNNLEDCGHRTPLNYTDHWMTSSSAGPGGVDPMFMGPCSADVVTGPPSMHVPECLAKQDPSTSWRPDCLTSPSLGSQTYYLQTEAAEPVVVAAVVLYIGTDKASLEPSKVLKVHVNISLMTTEDQILHVHDGFVNITCTVTGVVINILHDLTQPLRETNAIRLEYESTKLGVYAVAFRTADWLQRGVHANCPSNSYYDNARRSCVTQEAVCQNSGCDRPAIKFADVTCSGHEEGQMCSVSCKSGYRFHGREPYIRCMNGSWTGDIRCTPTDCGLPRIPYASVDCPDGTSLNNKCKFDCLPPARKQGKSNVLQCLDDGLWSLAEGYCRVLCPPLTKMKNATLISTRCAEGTHDLGTSCSLKCAKGFKVKDQLELGRNFELVCTSAGVWEGGQCEQVRCTPLAPVYSGVYSCSNGFNAGSSCTIKCPGTSGVSFHLKCLKSGMWNKIPEVCPSDNITCPHLPDLLTSGVVSQCSIRSAGSSCQLSCEYPAYDIVQESVAELDGHNGPYISTLCTYTGDWTPNVAAVTCRPKCEKYFIGDGYCDPNNNQERCQWDGGDCCLSTSSSGYVSSCGPACTCKDPNTLENRSVINRVRRHHTRRQKARKIKRRSHKRRLMPNHH